MSTDVAMRAALARLCRNGIFAVRMMWMMSVSVSRDSISYSYIAAIADAHIGDEVLLCLVSLPKDCPPGG
jgi:hypothetical protein